MFAKFNGFYKLVVAHRARLIQAGSRWQSTGDRALRRPIFEQYEPRAMLATTAVLIDNFLAQPLPSEVAAGQEFSFYNVVGGDRGESFQPGAGEVNWAPGHVEARVLVHGGFAGVFESVNHLVRERLPLNFHALLPPAIRPHFQSRAIAVQIDIKDGVGAFKVELKSPSNELLWLRRATLTGGARRLYFPLPPHGLANVQTINLVIEGAAGNFFRASRVGLATSSSHLGNLEPFVWTYANLLGNYNGSTGLVRDRANFPSGDFDNVSATGGFALLSVLAEKAGITQLGSSLPIVEKVTSTVLQLPRYHGVLPHFVRGGAVSQIVPGTEWSSLDTVLTYVPILQARQILGLSTAPIEQALTEIDWTDLRLDNGTISHGYSFSGARLSASWDVFGGESFMAVLAHAAARPAEPLASVRLEMPPTFNGSGFVDELAALYVPMPYQDIWGNNWTQYRADAAQRQLAHYARSFICCASAAEVPEPWKAPGGLVYQEFGIGGRIPDNDGTQLLGHLVAAPHYPAMLASRHPTVTGRNWEFLKQQGAISPLNVVESVYVVSDSGVNRAVWNPLKGAWNLLLAGLGHARAVSGELAYLPYRAAVDNSFLAMGIARLTSVALAADFNTGTFAGSGFFPAGGSTGRFVGALGPVKSPNGTPFGVIDTAGRTSTRSWGGTQGSVFTTATFVVPPNSELSFEYAFLTNEATPSARFNDFALVELLAEGGQQVLLQTDTFAAGFVSALGSGYRSRTEWKTATINLASHAGQAVQLRFLVSDRTHTVINSALTLDNLRVSIPPTASVAALHISSYRALGPLVQGERPSITVTAPYVTLSGQAVTKNNTLTSSGSSGPQNFAAPTWPFIAMGNAKSVLNYNLVIKKSEPKALVNDTALLELFAGPW
jgi:hypothetical protein